MNLDMTQNRSILLPGKNAAQQNRTMVKRVAYKLEFKLKDVLVSAYKRTYRGKTYKYPIFISCLAVENEGKKVPVGVKIHLYEVRSCSVKSLFLSLSTGTV